MSGITFASIAVVCAGIVVACYYLENKKRESLKDETDAEAGYNLLMRRVMLCNDTLSYWELDMDIEVYEIKYQKLIPYGVLFQYVGRLKRKMKTKEYLKILQ